jgi:hypothetical protein
MADTDQIGETTERLAAKIEAAIQEVTAGLPGDVIFSYGMGALTAVAGIRMGDRMPRPAWGEGAEMFGRHVLQHAEMCAKHPDAYAFIRSGGRDGGS